ncbi:MAG: hypothetical protein ACTSVV_04550 [Promethearchaeota archaeon]
MTISELGSILEIIISDDFSTYKKVVKLLFFDIIHIRYIHKPPYGRIVIDITKHGVRRIIISHRIFRNIYGERICIKQDNYRKKHFNT